MYYMYLYQIFKQTPRERMLEYLTFEQLELRDTELAVAIINSQNNRKYRKLLLMLKKFPI